MVAEVEGRTGRFVHDGCVKMKALQLGAVEEAHPRFEEDGFVELGS